MQLSNSVLLVSGAAEGIGRGVAEAFHASGASVVLIDIQDDKLNALAQLFNTTRTDSAKAIHADCSSEDEIKVAVQCAFEWKCRLDHLVNVVGTAPGPQAIDTTTSDDYRKLFELNVMSGFLFSKYALPALRKSGDGSITNISSISNVIGSFQRATYCATKAAQLGFTKALAVEEAPNGVRVNCVSPSGTNTPLHQRFNKLAGDPEGKGAARCHLLGRVAQPIEIGEACVYLATAKFVTGIDLLVSGGAELDYGAKTKIGRDSGIYN